MSIHQTIQRTSKFRNTRPYISPTTVPLEAFMPHHALDSSIQDDPVYRFESRSLQWGTTPPDLASRTHRWITWLMLPVAFVWLAFVIGVTLTNSAESIYRTAAIMLTILFMLTLMDKLVLDFAGLLSGLDSISADMRDNRWQLLLASDLSAKRILQTKHLIAQIRVWHLLVFVMVIRVVVVMSAFYLIFGMPLTIPQTRTIFNVYQELAYIAPVGEAQALAFATLMGFWMASAIYVIEPRWRLKALTAASLAASSYGQPIRISIVLAYCSFFGISIAQLFMTFSTIMVIISLRLFFFSNLPFHSLTLLCIASTGIGIFQLYHTLTKRWLRQAHGRLVAQGSAP